MNIVDTIEPDDIVALCRLRMRAMLAPLDISAADVAEGAHVVALDDYQVTYALEFGHEIGWCRHLVVAPKRLHRTPDLDSIWFLALTLGFVGRLNDCQIWEDALAPSGTAINVLQPLHLHPCETLQ
jgi:hypothetical protein